MSNTNMTVLEGRLTKSAELKYAQNGNAVCTFTLANNESMKNKAGEWTNITSFFDCVGFGKYFESMQKHLKKGRLVTITGRLKQDRWESNGQKMSRVTVKVSDISLGAEARNDNSNNYEPINGSAPVEQPFDNPFDSNTESIF